MEKWRLKNALSKAEFSIETLTKQREAQEAVARGREAEYVRMKEELAKHVDLNGGGNRQANRLRIAELEQELSDTRLKLKAKDEAIQTMQTHAAQRLNSINRLEEELRVCRNNLRSTTNLAHSHYRNWIQAQKKADELEEKLRGK